MSLEDPFFVVKGEVQKAANTASGLYQRWCQLLQETPVVSKEEFDWTTNELRNSLRSIDWDLEDLEETICIVESNPRKFKIEPSEVAARRSFVTEMRASIKEMRDHISSPEAQPFVEKKNREMLVGSRENYRLLDAEDLTTANLHTLEEQQLHQKLILDKQDEQLELVSGSIRVLKYMSGRVGEELDEQAVMLEDFAHEMDSTHSHMDGVLKKMAGVSHMTSDRRQWCIICLLVVILVVVVVLLFAL
ncbi:syntaxin-10 [Tiliqua scincoides]|uniref:syntaxin-10 n=1 Tax=Tiliqua scincoides TaxID=71010 RepID=UPI0034619577